MPPLFGEMRRLAMRERRVIVAKVLRADDSVQTVSFGPRGGWRVIE